MSEAQDMKEASGVRTVKMFAACCTAHLVECTGRMKLQKSVL